MQKRSSGYRMSVFNEVYNLVPFINGRSKKGHSASFYAGSYLVTCVLLYKTGMAAAIRIIPIKAGAA